MRTAVSTRGTQSGESGVPRETGDARFAPWIASIVLAVSSVIFTGIGMRYISDPVGSSVKTGVTLSTPLAYTTTRVGFGAFPLAFALFSLTCLISRRRLFEGVTLILILDTTVIGVRIYSLIVDGAERESVMLFIPELILLALAITALLLDVARRRAVSENRP